MLIFLVYLFIAVTNACIRIRVNFKREADFKGEYLIDGLQNNRPVYKLDWRIRAAPLYLYNLLSGDTSRWVIGDEPGGDSAMAYISSWAVQPHNIKEIDPKANWKMITSTGRWVVEPMKIICVGGIDFTVYLTSETQPWLTGFYFATKDGVGMLKHASSDMYLMRSFDKTRWYIGPETDPKTTSTRAFIDSTAVVPGQIREAVPDRKLGCVKRFFGKEDKKNFCSFESNLEKCPKTCSSRNHRPVNDLQAYDGEAWVSVTDFEVLSAEDGNLWEYLHVKRYSKVQLQPAFTLSNGLRVPIIGFGTGGLRREVAAEQVENAMNAGYKLIDTAEGYDNEDAIGGYLAKGGKPTRDAMFLQTKLWPTNLGFHETSKAIEDSLERLRTAYIDSYLINWPECVEDVVWMDCSHVKNPDGTWQSSYEALRKYYAEGKLLSIGISNFDVNQIFEAINTGTPPHILQNFMDFWEQSPEVEFCNRHGIFFQAYSSLKPLATGKRMEQENQLTKIGDKHSRTKFQIANRAVIQQGCGVIPRTIKKERLKENLHIFDFRLTDDEFLAVTGQEDWKEAEEVDKKEL